MERRKSQADGKGFNSRTSLDEKEPQRRYPVDHRDAIITRVSSKLRL